ncbi:DUF4157 domain-containing protein [Maribacter sp. 2307UL18-2]|uniref:eCIS core domain-containing protein n=1 Tax=Maribacter sp. 2307UL18-2 TaxID=3386274 RepID=UPI0039BCDFD0
MVTTATSHDSSDSSVATLHRRNTKESRGVTTLEATDHTKTAGKATFGHASFFQPKLQVNTIGDPFEVEADRVSEEVTQSIYSADSEFQPPNTPPASGDGGTNIQRLAFFQRKPAFESPTELDQNTASNPEIQRSATSQSITPVTAPPPVHQQDEEVMEGESDTLQRKTSFNDVMTGQEINSDFESKLHQSKGGGSKLSDKTRSQMESAFGADFGKVRIHTNSDAVGMNNQVQAHAFTHGSDIYFNEGAYQPEKKEGTKLLAHELTHVVQQGGAAKTAVQRSAVATVSQAAPAMVQRGIISRARNWAADKANHIPGFSMLTVIIGFNPINGQDVPRNAANIFRGIMGFLPGGDLIWRALNNHGIFDQVGNWIVQQLETLGDIGGALKDAFWEFVDSLSLSDFAPWNIGGLWPRAKGIFMRPINMIKAFVRGLVNDIIQFIKDAILRPLADLASQTRAWDLLIAVIGTNPITGEDVPRTADTLIGGFMKLIGQEEIWENIKRGNAIARAWAWFQGAMSAVIALVTSIPTRFMNALKSLTITDIVLVPRAFAKLVGVFAGFAVDFVSWAGNAMWELLKIIFSVVAPGAMPFLERAGGAIKSIFENPMGFLGNLVQAGKMGFQMFKDNIGSILREVLIDWLTGTLAGAGVYIPTGFDFVEILKFVLSVLGLTWENMRAKLVEHLGEGPVVVLEEGFELIQLLVTEGPAAAWEKIMEHISTLKDTVIGEIITWVSQTVVTKAVAKLVSMFIPGAGFIQAILAIWGAIKVFIQRIQKIIQVGVAFMNSIADIVAGNLMPAAMKVVNTMKGILVLAVSFLAEFIGLGKIGEALQNILQKIREPIDKALDKMILWVKSKAQRFLKGKDDEKHGQIINQAIEDMKAGDSGEKTYEQVRAEKIAEARVIEQKYQPELKDNIKISIIFDPPQQDKEDNDLDFTVTIAPNTSSDNDAIEVNQNSSEIPPELVPGLRLMRSGGANLLTVRAINIEAKTIEIVNSSTPTTSRRTNLDTFVERFKNGEYEIVQGFVQADVPYVELSFYAGGDALKTLQDKNIDQGEARTEYERQLSLAETELRAMNVGKWHTNRSNFRNLGRPSGESTIRRRYRDRFAQNLADLYKIKMAQQGTPISDAQAMADARQRMTGMAALHLDQVLGGDPDRILGMGIDTINTSIGSTASNEVNKVDIEYDPFVTKLNVTEKDTLLMNVSLVYKGPKP